MTFSEGRRLTLISSFEESIGEHRNKIIVLLDNERLQVPDKMTYWHCNIQDMYDLGTQFELYNKWEKVKAQLIGAPKDNDCNINFLSGNSGGGAVWPYFVASGHISGSTYADRLWTGTVVTDTDTRSPDFPRVQCIKWFIWRLCSVQYEGTNVLTTNFLNDRNNGLSRNYGLGLVFSDYPGTGLISAIIAQNFK